MKLGKYIFWFLLCLLLAACSRDNLDDMGVDFEPVEEPEVEIIEPSEEDFGISFRSADSQQEVEYQDGFGMVEMISEEQYFMEVLVRVDNASGLDPFLMGWFAEDVSPGVRQGELAFFYFSEDDGSSYSISSGLGTTGTSFTVDLKDIGGLGDIMLGSFSGVGLNSKSGELVEFSGSFNVLQGFCVERVIIDEMKYLTAPSANVTINSAEILGRCLYLNFRSVMGCGVAPVRLYDSGSIVNGLVPERNVRLVNTIAPSCNTILETDLSFNIDELRLTGESEVLLHLEGYQEPLSFKY